MNNRNIEDMKIKRLENFEYIKIWRCRYKKLLSYEDKII